MIERVIGAFNAAICTGRGNERKLVALAAEAGGQGELQVDQAVVATHGSIASTDRGGLGGIQRTHGGSSYLTQAILGEAIILLTI